jgi:pyridoxamine 5'-phosphate oxidase
MDLPPIDGPGTPRMTVDFSELRRDYRHSTLDESGVEPDPMRQFDVWFKHVVTIGLELPNAVVLATAGTDARPSARCVLLKDYGERGFVFYTHADSAKGRQIAENPRAALVFYWEPVHRQVRVEGLVERLPAEAAEAYFRTRPYGSRLSACVAPQSSVVEGRGFLEQRRAELDRKFQGGEVPAPESWTGYCVVPESIEFWQGREDRLHDRVLYQRERSGAWVMRRLAP